MLESPFNDFLGKELAKTDKPEQYLEKRLMDIKKRALEMNSAREKMRSGYQQVLEGLAQAFPDIDLKDANLVDSPNRMARALLEVCSGLGMKDHQVISTSFPNEKYNEVVILKNINFNSLCSHHFFPFTGVAHVGYLPEMGTDGAVVGLSKLARIVDSYARRPQLQERLCYSVMEALKNQLKPAGVMVVMEASHGCMTCRGAMKTNAKMVTSALDGKFKTDDKLRKEFLNLIKVQ
jgi:GTP cyclohydrolase I